MRLSKVSFSAVLAILYIAAAAATIASIQTGRLLPVNTCILLFWFIFATIFFSAGNIGGAVLPRFFLCVFGASYLLFFDYLISDYSDFASGMALVDSMAHDDRSVSFVLSCGILGLTGLSLGYLLIETLGKKIAFGSHLKRSTNKGGLFSLFCYFVPGVMSLLLFLIMPRDTILTTDYAELSNGASRAYVNLSVPYDGLGYIIYIWIAAIWVVSEDEGLQKDDRRWLRRWVYILMTFVIVATNLLKGGRSSAGLVACLIILYLTEKTTPRPGASGNASTLFWLRLRKVFPYFAIVFVVFMSWNNVRVTLSSGGIDFAATFDKLLVSYKAGEWVAGTFACFGMAEEYLSGTIQYYFGQTYIDYLLSLPPSTLANIIHYERPINSLQGPSWWYMGYTVGGMSPVIVPFKNFGPIGVVVHMTICGAGIAFVGRWAESNSPAGRILAAAVLVGSFHWFWYGDMYIMRALAAGVIVAWLHRLMIKGRAFSPSSPQYRQEPLRRKFRRKQLLG